MRVYAPIPPARNTSKSGCAFRSAQKHLAGRCSPNQIQRTYRLLTFSAIRPNHPWAAPRLESVQALGDGRVGRVPCKSALWRASCFNQSHIEVFGKMLDPDGSVELSPALLGFRPHSNGRSQVHECKHCPLTGRPVSNVDQVKHMAWHG